MRRFGLGIRAKRSVAAWRADRQITGEDLLADVGTLAARLPASRFLVNLAADRYAFVVGFLAAVATSRISLLPPSRTAVALARLQRQYPDAIALVETEHAPCPFSAVRIVTGTTGKSIALPDIHDDAIVAIMFTSGSTGDATPHAKSWGSLLNGARALQRELARRGVAHASMLGTVPPQHMYGFETTVMLPLAAGWPFHAGCPLLPADIRASLALVPGPAALATTPLHLRAIVQENLALADVACVISSTMPLARALALDAEALLRAPLLEIYGCTETGAIAKRRTAIEDVWRPLDDVRMHVAETAWCQGGHIEHPVPLADRVRLTDDGGFILEGRVGDMVKIAGKRTSLAALNSILMAVPGVLDGVFFSPLENSDLHARLGAIAVIAPDIDEQTIFARLAQHIDAAFLPRPLYRVDALPREPSGKLSIERLRDLVARLKSYGALSRP